jgi:hypothetical protein
MVVRGSERQRRFGRRVTSPPRGPGRHHEAVAGRGGVMEGVTERRWWHLHPPHDRCLPAAGPRTSGGRPGSSLSFACLPGLPGSCRRTFLFGPHCRPWVSNPAEEGRQNAGYRFAILRWALQRRGTMPSIRPPPAAARVPARCVAVPRPGRISPSHTPRWQSTHKNT